MKDYFIGIGGIGMSALARVQLEKGVDVLGSDISKETNALKEKGAKIFTAHDPKNILQGMRVIYSTAIPQDNPEILRAKELNLPIMHRSEFLEELMREKKALVVTGSHGKTTTSSLLASVFIHANKDPSIVIGGTLVKEGVNGKLGQGEHFISEGDESDGSFLRSNPHASIVTSFDPDHMEFWKTEKRLENAFKEFFQKTKTLFWCSSCEGLKKLSPPGISYGFSADSDVHITNVREKGFKMLFDLSFQGKKYSDIRVNLIGEHNVLNAASVFALSIYEGLTEEHIREAFDTFHGVHRRMEKVGRVFNIDLYDDYAHHPTEIQKTLKGFRKASAPARVVALFEPHRAARFSRHYDDFLRSFSDVDVLIVTDVFGAFAGGEEEVSSQAFADTLGATYIPKDQLIEELPKILMPYDSFITLGAGMVTGVGRELARKADAFQKMKAVLIYGGESLEHEISLRSSRYALRGLQQECFDVTELRITKDGKWALGDREPFDRMSSEIFQILKDADFAFPIVHGTNSEDGMVQGFLSTLGIPYAGSDWMGCSFSMNKAYVKAQAIQSGIPTAAYIDVVRAEFEEGLEKAKSLNFPVWVKPCHLGSSIGIKRITSFEDLREGMQEVFKMDSHLIIEEEILDRQIEVALFGADDFVETLFPGEIVSKGKFHDYEGKYGDNCTPWKDTADISEELAEKIRMAAKTIYQKGGLSGFARIDFFLDPKGRFFLNEINPLPGLTLTSLFPIMCSHAKLDEKAVIDKILMTMLYERRKKSS